MLIFLFIFGLVFLIFGAEALVRGSSRLAAALGISPLIIGLTVVAFGTSSPEFAVTINAAFSGQPDIGMGNIVGSNILNILLILGAAAIISPLSVCQQLIRIDVPLMISVSGVVLLFAVDQRFSRAEGLFLFSGLIAYTGFLIRQSRREGPAIRKEYAREYGEGTRVRSHWLANLTMAGAGLFLLIVGSKWLVIGGVALAEHLGISQPVIGLTVISLGTSLPEMVTAVIATLRGERDIAVGNVVGSNLFNIMGALGVAGIVAPAGLDVAPGIVRFDIPVMIVAAFACLPIFFSHGRIARWEGFLLLGYYIAYTLYLILAARHHAFLPAYGTAMFYFIIPLTLVTLIALALHHKFRHRISS